ncbi:MAG: hypothetical protein GF401_05905 [Chitinivibrionales bacterium]|nr:hypothetical protein [Chitinivibrionales bacterium]
MGLSEYIQSAEILKNTGDLTLYDLKQTTLSRGHEWFAQHPEERDRIRRNLAAFNLPDDKTSVQKVVDQVLLHYYEKLIPFCGDPESYYTYLQNHVDSREAIECIKRVHEQGKAALLATSHFGAIEMIAPVLAMAMLPVAPVLRFRTRQLSDMAARRAKEMEATGKFGPVRFIEIGKPHTVAALDMAAALRRKDVLLSMVDEKTEYSIPVTLLKRKIAGGAGLDRLLKFVRAPVSVFKAFMIRQSDETYRFRLYPVAADSENPVQELFYRLEEVVRKQPEQWYFLHEKIPFMDS